MTVCSSPWIGWGVYPSFWTSWTTSEICSFAVPGLRMTIMRESEQITHLPPEGNGKEGGRKETVDGIQKTGGRTQNSEPRAPETEERPSLKSVQDCCRFRTLWTSFRSRSRSARARFYSRRYSCAADIFFVVRKS